MAKKKVAPLTAESQGISHQGSADVPELLWHTRPLARAYDFAPPLGGLDGGYDDRLAVLAGLIQSASEMYLAQRREVLKEQKQRLADTQEEFWRRTVPFFSAPSPHGWTEADREAWSQLSGVLHDGFKYHVRNRWLDHLDRLREELELQEFRLKRIIREFLDALDDANHLPSEDARLDRLAAWLKLLEELAAPSLPPHLHGWAMALDTSEVRP